ncbi:DNA translocase FtsK [Pseudobacteroides cellulosolvens]|uniref:Cell division FtsK/SpoIIIE n=1 Tax=Pseudobacteroides cellulosolvens ATCC 35603 = DSM 2933 TaxID=398512 RepID=A0A0L6JLV7_9FIRM|nr:DNA translocase FtsK [Pseudobacteroides cellulosolvens]KNY26744.1 cell division FtsK/SpoIIIE [Pseudobacteroides cellulosolvens ATCC 35603 = DSM 2933]
MKVKRIQKKKNKKNENGILRYNHEIIGLILLTLGVLAFIGMINSDLIGAFGNLSKSVLLGFMGIPAYVIPPMLIVYSAFMIFKKNDTLNQKYLHIIIVLLMLSSIISTGFYSSNYDKQIFTNQGFIGHLFVFYDLGNEFSGGGILGGIISTPLISIFRPVGTLIILTSFSIIMLIRLTNISLASFLKGVKNKSTELKVIKGAGNAVRNTFRGSVADEDGLVPKRKFKLINFNTDSDDVEESALNTNQKKNPKEIKNERNNEFDISVEGDVQPNSGEISLEAIMDEDVEFIMKDVKKKKKIDVESLKNDVDKEISLQEMVGASYNFPPLELLNDNDQEISDIKTLKNTAMEVAKKLEETLKSFGVDVKVINISRGPAVTRYELQPSPGVKVSKIVNLADDISLNLAASGVRIEAPIPGKAAIGIEVPNKEVIPVFLKEVVESREFQGFPSKLAFSIGKDISGNTIVGDIGKMPHMLIAGSTGSGKSVCINSIIVSILYKSSPDDVKLLMVDPKVVELGIYNGIPHLLIPVVTDAKKAAGALNWAVQEMVNRYKLFAEKGVRDIKGYNSVVEEDGQQKRLPQVVIIIDELADLMMVAPNEVEDAICRLAQMARAAGMHLVIATQRPSVDVITGVIKANIPSRIAFAVSSQVDSRTILDMAGAEKLLGRGDMLFYPVGEPKPIRVKGTFVSDKEVERVVEFIKTQGEVEYNNDLIDEISNLNTNEEESDPGDNDSLLPQATELVVEAGMASVSLIQRKFKVGYARAARIVDQMEARGIVGKFEGSKPRQVLISRQQWQELQMSENK